MRTAATDKGVAYDFVRSGKVWARGWATLEKTETGARATWRFIFARPAESVEFGVRCALDVGKFDPATFEVRKKGDVRIRTLMMRPPTEARNSFFDGRWGWPFHSAYLIKTRMPKRTQVKKGDSVEFSVDFSSSVPLSVTASGLYVAGAETGWVRMDHRKDILPGSALDFSTQGLQDAPAGKYGWLKFADNVATFEKCPGVPQRFSGVNFCGEANYPKTPEEAENRAERLRRLGYNALRIHHHDNFLARYENGRLVPNEEYFDRLDRLVDACVRRGIYLTTDLYVSRRSNSRSAAACRTKSSASNRQPVNDHTDRAGENGAKIR